MEWKSVSVAFLYLLSLVLVGWAVKIFDSNLLNSTDVVLYESSQVMKHSERKKTWSIEWIFKSNVCTLGRTLGFFYFVFAILTIFIYAYSTNKVKTGRVLGCISIAIIVIGGFLASYLNKPLAIRLLPASLVIISAVIVMLI
jgi:hypothetical protein